MVTNAIVLLKFALLETKLLLRLGRDPVVFYLRSYLVSGFNEAQVLDVSSQKEFSERQSDS